MRKLLLFSMALLISASVYSQRNQNNDYWNTWRYTPKKEMAAEFESAVAKKMQKFNSTTETAIVTYKIITGRNSGTYERVESMKYPKDYDKDRSGEGEYWQKNVSKYVERSSGQMRWDRINNATSNWDPESPGTPSKYIERTTFDVKPGKITHFRRFVLRVTKIRNKRGAKGTQLMFRCISGGNSNMFVLVNGWNKYQDDRGMNNLESTFREDYNREFGGGTFEDDFQNFHDSLEAWGEMTETMELVPSLTTGMMN
jgi:hypothetical protein